MRDFATTVWNLPSHVPGSCPQRRTLRGESPNRVEWPQDYALLAMWGPRWIAKLVNITPITMIYGTYNNLITIVNGVNLNQLITGGPHIVAMGKQHERWRFSWEGLWIGLKCVQKKDESCDHDHKSSPPNDAANVCWHLIDHALREFCNTFGCLSWHTSGHIFI